MESWSEDPGGPTIPPIPAVVPPVVTAAEVEEEGEWNAVEDPGREEGRGWGEVGAAAVTEEEDAPEVPRRGDERGKEVEDLKAVEFVVVF